MVLSAVTTMMWILQGRFFIQHLAFPSVAFLAFLPFPSVCYICTSKQAFPSPICMQKSGSRLVCTSRFSLKIKLFEFRRFSNTCLDRYQQMIQVIANAHPGTLRHTHANAHFSEIKHISLCNWKVWIQKFYSTQFSCLTFTSHFAPASAQHTQVAACQVWESFAVSLWVRKERKKGYGIFKVFTRKAEKIIQKDNSYR